MAIQVPGITKTCGICERAYLKGSSTTTREEDGLQPDKEPDYDLKQLIIAACTACVYCGGKFVG
jgi:hypothetical protein